MRVTRCGGGLHVTKQEWMKYGGVFLLAVVAFGLAAIALTRSRGTGEPVDPVVVSPTAVTPTPSAPPTLTPTATATVQQAGIQLPAEPALLILGDSYTAGVGAVPPDQGWAYLVAASLGYPSEIDGVPGTGFAWGGGLEDNLALEYEVRLQKIAANPTFVPNVLILQGGQNDSLVNNLSEVETATARTIDSARRLWPGIQVVVLGPSAPQPVAQELSGANSAVRAGAATANAPFIDAYETGWFTEANSPGLGSFGANVNTAGHRYIAEKFLESWAALVQ
jgi:lysophospholipase L1-like esterase